MSYKKSKETTALTELTGVRLSRNYRQLVRIAQTAITSDTNNVDAWYNLALAYYSLRFYDKAVSAFHTAKQITPSKEKQEQIELLCHAISMLSRLTKFMKDEKSQSPTSKLESK